GENCILIDKGANQHVTVNYVETLRYIIEQSDVLVIQLEIPIEAVKHAMKIAKDKGVIVLFNPAPATEEAKTLLQYADIIKPNEKEILLLNGLEVNKVLDEKQCINLARNLRKKDLMR